MLQQHSFSNGLSFLQQWQMERSTAQSVELSNCSSCEAVLITPEQMRPCSECNKQLCSDCWWICGYCKLPACMSHVPHAQCLRRSCAAVEASVLSAGRNDHAKGVLRPVDAPASALSPPVPAPSLMPEEEEEEF